jgi:hypothetical protein
MPGWEISAMTRLIVDADLPDKLPDLVEPVELCDASGRVFGRYFPQVDPAVFQLEPRITPEELERRRRSNEQTYTTAEVLAHLEKR